MAMDNNGKTVERVIAFTLFLIQIGAIALSYGMLKQQVSDMSDRVERLERYVDERFEGRRLDKRP